MDRPTAFFLLAEVRFDNTDLRVFSSNVLIGNLLQVFLVIHYRPVIEELASIILSADIETVEDVQRRYGEQVSFFFRFWLK